MTTSLTWLSLLLLEIESIESKDLLDPPSTPRKGEKVIGTLTEEQKRLYTLWVLTEKGARLLKVEAEYSKDTSTEGVNMVRLVCVAGTLEEIFWLTVRDYFSEWSDGIGIRKGFKVVRCVQEDRFPSLRNLFKGIGE